MSSRVIFILAFSSLAVSLLAASLLFVFKPSEQNKLSSKQSAVKEMKPRVKKTNLFKISVNKIPYPDPINADKWSRGGGITEAGGGALIQKYDYFLFLDFDTTRITQLDDIAMPENNTKDLHDFFYKNFSMKNVPKKRTLLYHSILTIKRPQKTILLIAYNYWSTQKSCYRLRIARTEFPIGQHPLQWKATADDWKTVFESNPCFDFQFPKEPKLFRKRTTDGGLKNPYSGRQYGAQMIPSKRPNHILLTLGHFGSRSRRYNKDDRGQILEINIDTGQKTIISEGHRNPEGLVRDGKGRVWSTEHGELADEVNLIEKGKHYGYPFVAYGARYKDRAFTNEQSQRRRHHDGFQKPIFAFVRSIGISGIIFIRDFAPAWNGDFLVASLKAGTLFRLRVEDKRVIFAEPIKFGVRIRHLYNHGKGIIVALGDEKHIFVIKPHMRPQKETQEAKKPKIADIALDDWKECMVCHGISKTSDIYAPTLYGVFGRKIGQSDFDNYSPNLKASNKKWNEKQLKAFLTDPDGLFEGTTMPDPGINDPRIIDAIIQHLRKLRP